MTDVIARPTVADLPEINDDIVVAVITGSRAQGLARSGSDWDTHIIYAAPTLRLLGLNGGSVHRTASTKASFGDCNVTEIGHLAEMIVKGGPTAVEILWSTERVEPWDKAGEHHDLLRVLREESVSRQTVEAFLGYANSQTKLIQKSGDPGSPKWRKAARHAIRVMWTAEHIALSGRVLVKLPGSQREYLRGLECAPVEHVRASVAEAFRRFEPVAKRACNRMDPVNVERVNLALTNYRLSRL